MLPFGSGYYTSCTEKHDMKRMTLFVAMAIGYIGYYAFVGGTADQLLHILAGAGAALSLHWILNR